MSEQKLTGIALIPKLAQLDHVSFAKEVINNIKEGSIDPLNIHLFLKRFEAVQKTLKADEGVQELIQKEASKFAVDGKPFSYQGATITLAAVHTAYDFTGCNDPVWSSLNDIETKIKEMKKEREAMLKSMFPEKANLFSMTAPTIVVDKVPTLEWADVGEEYSLNAPLKLQTPGIKVSFKTK